MRVAKRFFISFIEENIQDPSFKDWRGGRVEVTASGGDYPDEEIRFLTAKLSELYRLRDEYDFKEVGAKDLDRLRRELQKYHQMRMD